MERTPCTSKDAVSLYYYCQESAAAYKDLDLRGFDPDAPDSDDDPISDIEE